ncbi:MAG: hypothetical protein ABSE73_10390 [Planctomycetota bacterium]
MVMTLSGVVNGTHIELESETGLPPGTLATVSIEERKLSPEEIDALIDKTAGIWADRPDLEEIFEQIEHERRVFLPREVDFDSPSGL